VFTSALVIIYQQPYGQQQLPQVVYQGQQNPAANFEEKKETNEPVTNFNKQFYLRFPIIINFLTSN